MKLQIVQIGNSFWIRIPKALLKQCDLKDSVLVTIADGNLVLSPYPEPRES